MNMGEQPKDGRLCRESIAPVKIGSLCSDCTNPEEKVMQSYVFDLDAIIERGMYEKAEIATEVLLEQGGDSKEIARTLVFPTAQKVRTQYETGTLPEAQYMKSLEAARIAVNLLRREAPDGSAVMLGTVGSAFPKEEAETWPAQRERGIWLACGYEVTRE